MPPRTLVLFALAATCWQVDAFVPVLQAQPRAAVRRLDFRMAVEERKGKGCEEKNIARHVSVHAP